MQGINALPFGAVFTLTEEFRPPFTRDLVVGNSRSFTFCVLPPDSWPALSTEAIRAMGRVQSERNVSTHCALGFADQRSDESVRRSEKEEWFRSVTWRPQDGVIRSGYQVTLVSVDL